MTMKSTTTIRRLPLMTSLALVLSAFAPAATADEPQVLFEDRFDGRLAEGWAWVREQEDAWRLRDGALEIRLLPGHAQTVRNALVRPAPERAGRTLAFEVTVEFTVPPKVQYEQAGLTWYHEGEPVFKLVHELVDGETCIIPGKHPTETSTMHLRLVTRGDEFHAQFRPAGGEEFQTAAKGTLPAGGEHQISLQGYHGPDDAEHWVRFKHFRILELDD